MSKYWNLSAPITVHVEITNACNEKCRHCYNFSRANTISTQTISQQNLEYTIAELIKNKVMHVIVTGGEPLLALDKAVFLIKKSLEAGISISLNSNMKIGTSANLKVLYDAGVDHILTTLHSHKKEVHDSITCTPGSFEDTVENIKGAARQGIRITVNTILNQFNKDGIYKIGKFAHQLGVTKFLGNRTTPCSSNIQSLENDFRLEREETIKMFDTLLQLKKDFGLQVGTCRTVPQCLFDDLEKYKDFIARGCSGGKRYVLLNVNGDAHACTSDDTVYGNIHQIGLAKIWENMSAWRTMAYIPKECQACHLFGICDAGCRMIALHHTGKMDGFDNLRRGAEHLKPYKKEITVRQEEGFSIIRAGLGAKVIFVDDKK